MCRALRIILCLLQVTAFQNRNIKATSRLHTHTMTVLRNNLGQKTLHSPYANAILLKCFFHNHRIQSRGLALLLLFCFCSFCFGSRNVHENPCKILLRVQSHDFRRCYTLHFQPIYLHNVFKQQMI